MSGSRLAAIPLLAVVLLSGCGSDDRLSDAAAAALQKDVAAVSAAMKASDRAKATAALAAVRDEVAKQLAAGEISGDRARAILTAAQEVADDLPAAKPAAVVTKSPTPSPKPVVQTRTPEQDRGKGKGKDDDDEGKDD